MSAKSNILIIEKEGIVATDMERILEKLGYAVSAIAFSGEEAIQKAQENKPDLVLTETSIESGMDGIEAARSIYTKLNIPIVFITAVSDRDTIERAKIAEPYGFIIKPFEEELLHATIEMAIYRHRMDMNKAEEKKNNSSGRERNDGNSTSEAGLRADWTRATFIVRKEHLEKIKALAYWERKKLKELLDEALESYLKDNKFKSIMGVKEK
jgi:DNA-binding NarL/FixJ family response regulator